MNVFAYQTYTSETCALGVIWLSIRHVLITSVPISQKWQTLETSSNTAQLA